MSFEEKATFASLPRVKRGVPTFLKGDPKGKNFLYTNGHNVFIRNLQNPIECDVYSQHSKDTTVAVYAPSGFYIASGDASGNLRIWDTTQKEHILKFEYRTLSRAIKDIAWSDDSKRIAAVGDGSESFSKVFLWDSGTSVGKLDSHGKCINAVDYKSTRPYRICTASEDFNVNFYEGPPFKYKSSHSCTNFVNCVKYSPNGEWFVSGGADGKLFLYDGKEGTVVAELSDKGKAHSGGVYGVSWSPDSLSLLSASADKTCKIWNIGDKSLTTTFKFGSSVEDMQVGCLWQKDTLLSLSLSGYINYLDKENPETPSKVLVGHFLNITAVATCQSTKKIYSASFEGRIVSWEADGSGSVFKGKGHTNEIRFMAIAGEDTLVTCAIDDTVRFTSLETQEYGSDVLALGGQPHGLGVGKDGLLVVSLEQEVLVIRNKNIVSKLKVHYETSGVSVHPGQAEVAIGAKNERNVYIYSLDNDTLVEKTKAEISGGCVLLVDYSPDGAYLGVVTDNKKSYMLQTSDYKDYSGELYGHTGRLMSLAWSPDSQYLATAGLDGNAFVYRVAEPKKKAIAIKFAHNNMAINCISWLDENTLVSAAADCCIKIWNFTR